MLYFNRTLIILIYIKFQNNCNTISLNWSDNVKRFWNSLFTTSVNILLINNTNNISALFSKILSINLNFFYQNYQNWNFFYQYYLKKCQVGAPESWPPLQYAPWKYWRGSRCVEWRIWFPFSNETKFG
jgi:hypothetical protein